MVGRDGLQELCRGIRGCGKTDMIISVKCGRLRGRYGRDGESWRAGCSEVVGKISVAGTSGMGEAGRRAVGDSKTGRSEAG